VAELFDVSPKTVTRWAQKGRIPCFKTLGGHRRYDGTQVRELLDEAGLKRYDELLGAPEEPAET